MKPEEITKSFLIDFRSQLRNVPLSDKRVSNILTPLRGAIALAMERDILHPRRHSLGAFKMEGRGGIPRALSHRNQAHDSVDSGLTKGGKTLPWHNHLTHSPPS